MPVQPGGPVLVETICRADTYDPQAGVDRTVRSVHYPVAVGTVTLAIACTRWAVNELAVIPADGLLAAPATEGLASDIQHAPPGGQILRQAADLLFEDPARVHAVIIGASRETGQQLVSDRNPEKTVQERDDGGACGQVRARRPAIKDDQLDIAGHTESLPPVSRPKQPANIRSSAPPTGRSAERSCRIADVSASV